MSVEDTPWTSAWYYNTLLDVPYEPKLHLVRPSEVGSRILAAKRKIAASLERQATAIGRIERAGRTTNKEAGDRGQSS